MTQHNLSHSAYMNILPFTYLSILIYLFKINNLIIIVSLNGNLRHSKVYQMILYLMSPKHTQQMATLIWRRDDTELTTVSSDAAPYNTETSHNTVVRQNAGLNS